MAHFPAGMDTGSNKQFQFLFIAKGLLSRLFFFSFRDRGGLLLYGYITLRFSFSLWVYFFLLLLSG
ncbi:hypothetical protein F4811DRAFT_295352 [Daldinia bambusicola]|nr:hypothetical protein F4811DRAFT_295352 [Daldinia bambusicola]